MTRTICSLVLGLGVIAGSLQTAQANLPVAYSGIQTACGRDSSNRTGYMGYDRYDYSRYGSNYGSGYWRNGNWDNGRYASGDYGRFNSYRSNDRFNDYGYGSRGYDSRHFDRLGMDYGYRNRY